MKPLAVYVHIPFCTVKCGYCDFNAYAGLHDLAPAYCDALERDIDSWASDLAGRELASVFFGGGTPSEVPASHIARVLAGLARHSTFATHAEISLEANPGTLTGDYLSALYDAGVRRLSIGAQSFHDSELRFLDRIHSSAASAATVRLAREAGFSNLSLDLIYGLPGASLERWLDSLGQAIALGPEHLSCYALTVEEGTPLARRVLRGEVAMPDGDVQAEMYEQASETLLKAGYVQYEISSWARPGYECRHNRVYWTWADYLPIGAGAHGFMGGRRYENVAHPREYIEATARPGERVGVANEYQPDLVTSIGDWLATRLRLLEGFAPGEFLQQFGFSLATVAAEALERCALAGLLDSAERVRLTAAGRLLHGEVALQLLLAARANPALPVSPGGTTGVG